MPFFAPVAAFFLLAVGADEVAGAAAAGAAAVEVVLEGDGVEPVATFLFDAFFVGDAERFRLVPAAALGLLDERAFFVPADFFAPLGLFDRLRGLAEADFFAGDFFLAAVFFAAEPDPPILKLPLAPTPLVCFNELFFVPARKADLRC